jgi:hypothetical protein
VWQETARASTDLDRAPPTESERSEGRSADVIVSGNDSDDQVRCDVGADLLYTDLLYTDEPLDETSRASDRTRTTSDWR